MRIWNLDINIFEWPRKSSKSEGSEIPVAQDSSVWEGSKWCCARHPGSRLCSGPGITTTNFSGMPLHMEHKLSTTTGSKRITTRDQQSALVLRGTCVHATWKTSNWDSKQVWSAITSRCTWKTQAQARSMHSGRASVCKLGNLTGVWTWTPELRAIEENFKEKKNWSKYPARGSSIQTTFKTIKKDSEKHTEVELLKMLAIKQKLDFHMITGDTVIGLLGRWETEPSFYPGTLRSFIQTHVLPHSLRPGSMEVA